MAIECKIEYVGADNKPVALRAIPEKLHYLSGNIYKLTFRRKDNEKPTYTFLAKGDDGKFYNVPLDEYNKIFFKYGMAGVQEKLEMVPDIIHLGIPMKQEEMIDAIQQGKKLETKKKEEKKKPGEGGPAKPAGDDEEREETPVEDPKKPEDPKPDRTTIKLAVYNFADGKYIVINESLKNNMELAKALGIDKAELDALGKDGFPSSTLKFVSEAQLKDAVAICDKANINLEINEVDKKDYHVFNVLLYNEGLFITSKFARLLGIGKPKENGLFEITAEEIKSVQERTDIHYLPNFVDKRVKQKEPPKKPEPKKPEDPKKPDPKPLAEQDLPVLVGDNDELSIFEEVNGETVLRPVDETTLRRMVTTARKSGTKLNIIYYMKFIVITVDDRMFVDKQVLIEAGLENLALGDQDPVEITNDVIEAITKADIRDRNLKYYTPQFVTLEELRDMTDPGRGPR